jgi:hypothetical protein
MKENMTFNLIQLITEFCMKSKYVAVYLSYCWSSQRLSLHSSNLVLAKIIEILANLKADTLLITSAFSIEIMNDF